MTQHEGRRDDAVNGDPEQMLPDAMFCRDECGRLVTHRRDRRCNWCGEQHDIEEKKAAWEERPEAVALREWHCRELADGEEPF